MAARDPSRFGYLTRLSYETHTPAFLVKLQNRVAGVADDDDDDEFEDDGSGRPPIPKRPPIPQRPRDQPGSEDEDEDEGDEKPQVVVLKGKHLTAREVENERRKRAFESLCTSLSRQLRGDQGRVCLFYKTLLNRQQSLLRRNLGRKRPKRHRAPSHRRLACNSHPPGQDSNHRQESERLSESQKGTGWRMHPSRRRKDPTNRERLCCLSTTVLS